MSIPISTTTIRVLRPAATDEPYETPSAATVIASGIRAQISTSRGTEAPSGGDQEVVHFRLSCDPTDISHGDRIEDEVTGEVYDVQWARLRIGLGLNHIEAGLRQVAGVTSIPKLVIR